MHRLLIALIAFFSFNSLHAAEVLDLYQSQTAVETREEAERIQKAPQLLRDVMVKVVGNRAMVERADLSSVMTNANDYVQQFTYEITNKDTADLTEPEALAVVLTFHEDSVNQVLRNIGLPVWGKTRPDVLVWIGIEQAGQAGILGTESAPVDITEALDNAAKQRGLPLLMPLMDLQDQMGLNYNDIASHNQARVSEASSRYNAPIVLTASVQADTADVSIKWQASGDGFADQWLSSGPLELALIDGLGHLADKVSLNYSQDIDRNRPNTLRLAISNVMQFEDYRRLTTYLNKLDLVSSARVIELGGDHVTLELSYFGSDQVLLRTFNVDNVITEEEGISGADAVSFRLLP
jgi:hypothetical protein